ncbi:hypothetical protein [Planococcus sp. CAU13]|uniref:hypothetical protein n=1 Tax=Planococcus sp. CAU13 TaxID=1541197 RepID=UPI00052FFF6D|nr:hypothetical protein [Planococcus sp. CAU13]
MKKIFLLSLVLMFTCFASVQALSWAYGFVVWDGNVYEVKEEEFLQENEVGEVIGEVETQADDMTGNHYGNASNYYPLGTKYYEIAGTPASEAIAVEVDGQWLKAVYAHRAPFHIMNVFTNFWFISAIVLIVGVIAGIIIRNSRFVDR